MFRRNKFVQMVTNNWVAKICSLLLACAVFLFGTYYSQDVREVTIPVEVKLPSAVDAASTIPNTVKVKIIGSGDSIYLVEPSAIGATVDFSYLQDAGIATAPVVLTYDQAAYKKGGITIETDPSVFRVLFEASGGEGE
jgi:YbbR domain-containing protein